MKLQPFRRQGGAALLIMAIILILGFSSFLISALSKSLDATTYVRNRNAEVLQQAKAALIGYVAKEVLDLSENVPGRLPCPESPSDAGTDNEGRAGSTCDPTFPTNKNIGRLPWRTLGLDKLVDAASEPLWYAASPNWVLSGSTPIINSGTPGQLTVDGSSGVVAVIFAPGKPVSGATPNANQQAACGSAAINQSRSDRAHDASSSVNPDYRNYLECLNASSPIDASFGVAVQDNASHEVLNDQVVFVTAKDILNAIQGPLAERLQRTVAPLLSEYSTGWTGSGTILPAQANTKLAHFMPYAFPFVAPESATPAQSQCGDATVPTPEGLLPVASMALSGGCSSPWGSFAWSGSVGSPSCTTDASGAASCQFNYYTLRSITFPLGLGSFNLFQLLGIAVPTTLDVTLDSTAPYGASTFRKTLVASDFRITDSAAPSNVSTAAFTQAPNPTDGSAHLSVQIHLSNASAGLCVDTPAAFNIVCSTLGTLGDVCTLIPVLNPFCGLLGALLNLPLTAQQTATVQFPALSNPADLQGTQLSAGVKNGVALPLSLLNPSPGDPHYWFFSNEWYRYTYYAVAPAVSAAQSGALLTVSGFPPGNGAEADKRFVLALMGPATTGQVRSSTATLGEYVEGANAVTGTSPRTFAYQVYAISGNDRIAACPFSDGATPCD